MKAKLKQTKGITLIALIITIIVLLILATVSIRLIMNNGIIGKAESAVKTYSEAEEDEKEQLLQQEYEMAKFEGKTPVTYGEYKIEKELKEKYGQDIKIGDYVNYDEGNGYTYVASSDKGLGQSAKFNSSTRGQDLTSGTYSTEDFSWRVLGINDNGQIELIANKQTSVPIYIANEEAWLYGVEELNNMCNALYGQGKYAESARSVNLKDINRITGYDPTVYSNYGKTYIYRIGESLYDTNNYVERSTDGGKSWKTSTWVNKFDRFDETINRFVELKQGETYEVTTSEYNYKGADYLRTDDVAFEMLFSGTDWGDNKYLIADRYISNETAGYESVYWGITEMRGKYVSNYSSGSAVYNSWDSACIYCDKHYIRPVVTLKQSVKLTGNSTDGWKIN